MMMTLSSTTASSSTATHRRTSASRRCSSSSSNFSSSGRGFLKAAAAAREGGAFFLILSLFFLFFFRRRRKGEFLSLSFFFQKRERFFRSDGLGKAKKREEERLLSIDLNIFLFSFERVSRVWLSLVAFVPLFFSKTSNSLFVLLLLLANFKTLSFSLSLLR